MEDAAVIWILLALNLGLALIWLHERHANVTLQNKFERLYWLARQAAHDINSPLTALDAVSRNVQVPESSRQLLSLAKGRMQEIVQDFKLNASTMAPRPDRVSLRGVQDIVRDLIAEKAVSYTQVQFSNFWAPQPGQFLMNAVQLKRAVSNLLQNAIEALPFHQGTIFIQGGFQQQKFQLRVEDSGEGIGRNIIHRLGRRGQTFNRPDGEGLGLSQIKNAVREAGGVVQIESQPDVGTQITLQIPET